MMRGWLACLVLLPATAQGQEQAQEQSGQEVAQTNIRHDEDWSVLRNTAPTGWRRAKYIALDETGFAYLTLGGEARARFEGFDDNLWGDAAPPDDGYLWLRAMPSADLHAGPVRVFAQGIAGYARGVAGGKGPVDETGIDLLQGFGDVRLALGGANRLTLRAGRALVALGSERLVGTRYGPNIPQAFDGLHLLADFGGHRVAAFDLRPVAVGSGNVDDATSRTRRLSGMYTTLALAPGVGLDGYWLRLADDEARQGLQTGRERRDTFGLRAFGKRGRWRWNWEAMVQRGQFAGQRIRAWSIATETEWSLGADGASPKLRLRADIASGDRDARDTRLGSFNALFPKGRYFGELSPVGPRNIIHLAPAIDWDLGRGVSLELAAAFFWRATRGDGIYDIPGQLIRAADPDTARHIGDQIEIVAEWQPDELLSFTASLSAFRPGAYIAQTGPSRTIGMVALEARLRL
jgi:hypothetical protein